MILAIDVGKGTEDVLFRAHETDPIENSIQLVFPSTAQLLTDMLKTKESSVLYFDGDIMAGEPWNRVIYDKVSQHPNSVYMTEKAAMSLRYHLPQVESHGIIVSNSPPSGEYEKIQLKDVHWARIFANLQYSGIDMADIDYVLLACQDHGKPDDPSQSSRDFRMKTIYSNLDSRGRLEDLLMPSDTIPSFLPRHQSIANRALKEFSHLGSGRVLVMDSSPAVIVGAMDERDKQLIINVGNGHTLVIILHDKVVQAVYEAHTGGISTESILEDLHLILKNELSHEQSLERGGHGLYLRTEFPNDTSLEDYYPITLIGPRRDKIRDLPGVDFVHPMGNMMMAGPLGLIRSLKNLKKDL